MTCIFIIFRHVGLLFSRFGIAHFKNQAQQGPYNMLTSVSNRYI